MKIVASIVITLIIFALLGWLCIQPWFGAVYLALGALGVLVVIFACVYALLARGDKNAD